ncbi:MAG: hypothetical protein AABX01_02225 [Candidatus Micrarchaeota archaeon]
MADLFTVNQMLDAIIAILAIIVFILIFRSSPKGFRSRPHKIEILKGNKGLSETRKEALREMRELLDAKGELQKMISDAKRRYMKNELTYEASLIIEEDALERIEKIDRRLLQFEGMY